MKLYCGNLSWKTTSQDLREAFSRFGAVKDAKVVMDRENPDRSRGFGFVEFEDASDAETAIKAMDGHDLMGRTISVNEANDQR